MKKLVLIDGHSILHRAFYGVPDLTNSEGLHTNAIYGFLNILFKILEEEAPDYLTVAFDVHAPTFRHEIYKEYKGTRKPMPQELREQVPVLKEVLKAMGIRLMEQAGLEADDILGTLARRAEKAGLEVSLVSGDRERGRPGSSAGSHAAHQDQNPQNQRRENGDRGLLRRRCGEQISGKSGSVYRLKGSYGGYRRQYPRRSQGGRKDGHRADGAVWLP